MKKVIYTLNVNNYNKEITDLTYPLMQFYAEKIDADFRIITERKFPSWPVVYEKLQIFELGQDNDWNIYVDGDAVIHPDMMDITNHLSKDTVLHNGADIAGNRWKYDNYFRRDGRHIGSCNWFTVGSNWCIDLWRPLDDLTPSDAVNNIYPTVGELTSIITSEHLIDDYTLSRNIAKYGLKFKTFQRLKAEFGDQASEYLYHQYILSEQEKIGRIKQVLINWNLESYCKLQNLVDSAHAEQYTK